jgi:hypothetical protein
MFDHRPLPERFWKFVRKTDSCWEWKGSKFRTGYSRISVRGKSRLAHRVSFALNVGEIPEGMLICHRCDNRWCVNPEHLFIGSHADNAGDMLSKGRSSRGEKNSHSKLTEQAVLEIRQLQSQGLRGIEIAKLFGVDVATISHIKVGRHWKHLLPAL